MSYSRITSLLKTLFVSYFFTVLALLAALLAVFGPEVIAVLINKKGIHALVDLEDNIAAVTAVAAVRTSIRHI